MMAGAAQQYVTGLKSRNEETRAKVKHQLSKKWKLVFVIIYASGGVFQVWHYNEMLPP